MSRRRYLSTKISQDAKINRLATKHGDFAALLYTWMIPHAEDDGTLSGDPEELLMTVMPGRRDKDIADIETALTAMHELGLIVWTRDSEHPCVAFPESFYTYQTYVTEKRRGTAQGGNKAASSAHNSAHESESAQNAANQRKSAQNAASFKSSFTVKLESSSDGEGLSNRESADEAPEPTPEGEPLARTRTPSQQSTQPEASKPKKPANRPADPKPRSANPLWDVLVEMFYQPATADERKLFGRVARELREVNATPDEVRARVRQHAKTQSHWDLTPRALVTHWSELGTEASKHGNGTTESARRAALARETALDDERARQGAEMVRELAKLQTGG